MYLPCTMASLLYSICYIHPSTITPPHGKTTENYKFKLEASLYNILQILSATIFERMPLNQLLENSEYKQENCDGAKQLILFD